MDSGRRARRGDLRALAYHRDVADRLERDDPSGWATVQQLHRIAPSGQAGWADDPAAVDPAVLRSADRLEPEAHPLVQAALARAVENLGIDQSVAVYQGEGGPTLFARPDEVAVVLSRPLITGLPEAGLSAVLGQVLARCRFWSLDDGRYRVAERLLELLSLDAAPTLLETSRRYRTATALFTDRAAVVAGGDLRVAVDALVTADPELNQGDGRMSALDQWHQDLSADPAGGPVDRLPPGEAAARTLLRPGLDLAALDLFDRDDLERVTRTLLEDVLQDRRWRSEAVLAQARQYFPDLNPAEVDPSGSASTSTWGSAVQPVPAGASTQTRVYLGYVLLDLITADPDADVEAAVARAVPFAEGIGLGPDLERLARTELPLSAAAWNRITVAGSVSASGVVDQ